MPCVSPHPLIWYTTSSFLVSSQSVWHFGLPNILVSLHFWARLQETEIHGYNSFVSTLSYLFLLLRWFVRSLCETLQTVILAKALVYYTVLAFGDPRKIAHIDWYDIQSLVANAESDVRILGVLWYDLISPVERRLLISSETKIWLLLMVCDFRLLFDSTLTRGSLTIGSHSSADTRVCNSTIRQLNRIGSHTLFQVLHSSRLYTCVIYLCILARRMTNRSQILENS